MRLVCATIENATIVGHIDGKHTKTGNRSRLRKRCVLTENISKGKSFSVEFGFHSTHLNSQTTNY